MRHFTMTTNTKINKVDKPWGWYVDYVRSNDVVFKKIIVLPNQKLSYQYHDKRDEFWYVTQGTGMLTINGEGMFIKAGEHVLIQMGSRHNVECIASLVTGNIVPLVIYEMQCGECCEEDIVRLEDKYGRITE